MTAQTKSPALEPDRDAARAWAGSISTPHTTSALRLLAIESHCAGQLAGPVVAALKPLGAEIAADPGEHITADPLFVVFQKRRSPPLDDDYGADFYVWIRHDGDYTEADEKQSATLEKMQARGRDTGLWEKHALVEFDEFVTACFTHAGAEAYIRANGHNLRKPHIYVTSLFRNREMIELRNTLVAIGGGRGCPGYETPIATAPPACICHRCIRDHNLRGADGVFPLSSSRMILCPTCGNKRCPHASDHRNACTNSNEPGQPGSIY